VGQAPPYRVRQKILLWWVVGSFYAVDCEICVGEFIICGADFFCFEVKDMSVCEKKIPASFPGPPSGVVSDGSVTAEPFTDEDFSSGICYV